MSHISRSYRWKFLINPLGYKLGFINSVLAVFSAYLINYTIPRAGDLARATMISKYEKIPLEKTLGTIVAERAVDIICIIVIICIGLIIEFQKISEELINLTQNTEISTILIYVVAIFLLLFISNRVLKKSKYYKSLSNFFFGIIEGLTVIFKMKNRNLFIFHSIFIWLMYILMFWATSKAFVDLHEVTFFQLILMHFGSIVNYVFKRRNWYLSLLWRNIGWYEFNLQQD